MKTIHEILTTNNFKALLDWYTNPEAKAPEFAEKFMQEMDRAYTVANGRPFRRKGQTGAARLTLDAILNEKPDERPVPAYIHRPNPILEELTKDEKPAENKPVQQLTGNKIDFENEDGFKEIGMDSIILAGIIIHYYNQLMKTVTKPRAISSSFVQMTIYVIYGTLLAKRKTRLTTEHPQMWKYGPVFARAYNHTSKKGMLPNETAARNLKEEDPILDEFIERIVRIHFDTTITALNKEHMGNSSPWKKCRDRNGEKWNSILDDKEIETFFSRKLAK